jgi:intracellular sulfur oxidation DsrE/DsrF family protein
MPVANYLFIQSQDPFTETHTATQFGLIRQLREAGNTVAVLLVQNGVTATRSGAKAAAFDQLLDGGIDVMADSFSLQQREIATAQLKPGVRAGAIEVVADALLAGHKVIWN